jgi:hypothetical protein
MINNNGSGKMVGVNLARIVVKHQESRATCARSTSKFLIITLLLAALAACVPHFKEDNSQMPHLTAHLNLLLNQASNEHNTHQIALYLQEQCPGSGPKTAKCLQDLGLDCTTSETSTRCTLKGITKSQSGYFILIPSFFVPAEAAITCEVSFSFEVSAISQPDTHYNNVCK